MTPIPFNRDLVVTKKPLKLQDMCKLSGTSKKIHAKISDGQVITIHYSENAKCDRRNKKIVVEGNRFHDCRPITQEIMEKNPAGVWKPKHITVDCKVFVQE